MWEKEAVLGDRGEGNVFFKLNLDLKINTAMSMLTPNNFKICCILYNPPDRIVFKWLGVRIGMALFTICHMFEKCVFYSPNWNVAGLKYIFAFW